MVLLVSLLDLCILEYHNLIYLQLFHTVPLLHSYRPIFHMDHNKQNHNSSYIVCIVLNSISKLNTSLKLLTHTKVAHNSPSIHPSSPPSSSPPPSPPPTPPPSSPTPPHNPYPYPPYSMPLTYYLILQIHPTITLNIPPLLLPTTTHYISQYSFLMIYYFYYSIYSLY